MQKLIECYRLTTVGPDMVTIDNEYAFVTYIVVFAELKIQAEALQSSCLKQWEKTIDTEYNNLVCNSVIKWVDKLPQDKHAITVKVVYKKRENENGDFLKCYTYIVMVREYGQTLGLGVVDKNRTVVYYQSTTDIGLGDRHVTWKSCGIVQSGLEGLRVQKDREESRWSQGQKMMSRDMGSSWCTHGVHMYSGD